MTRLVVEGPLSKIVEGTMHAMGGDRRHADCKGTGVVELCKNDIAGRNWSAHILVQAQARFPVWEN